MDRRSEPSVKPTARRVTGQVVRRVGGRGVAVYGDGSALPLGCRCADLAAARLRRLAAGVDPTLPSVALGGVTRYLAARSIPGLGWRCPIISTVEPPVLDRSIENREKRAVAASSVAAGFLLTTLKILVGLATGSLGILAEAAHSALDLGAAAMTWFAVRASARPPDEDHHYGHQRVENLSALGETILLLITCGWILYEAIRRLVVGDVHVDVTVWAFVVMLISIVVDFSRSRALKRAADKYRSQALAADALHFSTDIASSSVVLVGLALVALGRRYGGGVWFERADAFAALGVATIVTLLSIRLGRESIDVLLDRAPRGLRETIARTAREVQGVFQVRRVRIRRSGPDQFIDLVVVAHGADSLEEAHRTADRVEERIRQALPRSDVVVHVEPAASWSDPASTVRGLAARRGLTIHDLAIHDGENGMRVDLHVEVPTGISLDEARTLVAPLEEDVRQELPLARYVNLHIDPIETGTVEGIEDPEAATAITAALEETVAGLPEVKGLHDLEVRRSGLRLYVSVHAVFEGGAPVETVHKAAEALEARLRRRFPEILRVLVHTEPGGTA